MTTFLPAFSSFSVIALTAFIVAALGKLARRWHGEKAEGN